MEIHMVLLHVIACFVYCSQHTNIGKSVLLRDAATDKGAVCLDGSAGRYYINTGVTEPHKFVMFIQGGGWCSGLYNSNGKGFNSCWDRRNTHYGSTRNDNETHDLNSIAFLENNQETNPLLYSWTKIFVRYCDGASFSGDVTQTLNLHDINNPNKTLFFRGKRILDAVFESLIQDYYLNNVTDFVFGGGSAGGLAVFLHANYIVNKYFDSNNTKFVALPDVGFFIDYNDRHANYSNAMKWIFKNQNVSSSIVSPHCFEQHANDTSNCIFAQNIARDITIPTFVLNSQYDEWQATYILGTNYTNPALLNEYGRNFTRIIFDNFLLQNQYNGNIYGVFIDSCYHHNSQSIKSFTQLYIGNYTQSMAFKEFYDSLGMNNSRNIWYASDLFIFPCHQCCESHNQSTQDITMYPTDSQTYYPTKFLAEYTSEHPTEYPTQKQILNITIVHDNDSDDWYHSIFGKNGPSNIALDIFIVCLIVVTGLLLIGILFWCGWLKGCTDVIWNTCCCGRYTQIQQPNQDYHFGDEDNNPETVEIATY